MCLLGVLVHFLWGLVDLFLSSYRTDNKSMGSSAAKEIMIIPL